MAYPHELDGYDSENEDKIAAMYGGACEICLSVSHLADTCDLRFRCPYCKVDTHDYDPNGSDEVAQWYGLDPQRCRLLR